MSEDLQEQLIKAQEEIASLKNINIDLVAELSEFNKTLTERNRIIDTLSRNNEELEKKIEKLKASMESSLQNHKAEAKQQLQAKEKETGELKNKIEELNQCISQKQHDLEKKEQEIESIKNDCVRLKWQVGDYKSQVSALTTKLEELKKEFAMKDKEWITIKENALKMENKTNEEFETLKIKCRENNEQIESLKLAVKSKEEEIKKLIDENRHLQSELELAKAVSQKVSSIVKEKEKALKIIKSDSENNKHDYNIIDNLEFEDIKEDSPMEIKSQRSKKTISENDEYIIVDYKGTIESLQLELESTKMKLEQTQKELNEITKKYNDVSTELEKLKETSSQKTYQENEMSSHSNVSIEDLKSWELKTKFLNEKIRVLEDNNKQLQAELLKRNEIETPQYVINVDPNEFRVEKDIQIKAYEEKCKVFEEIIEKTLLSKEEAEQEVNFKENIVRF